MKYDCAGINVTESAARLANSGDFELQLQPVIKPDERRLISAEAIVGSFDPERLQEHGITVDEMACLVKHRALGRDFDLQVLDKALAAVQRLKRNHGIELPVSINLGVDSVLNPDFPGRAWRTLERAGIESHFVQFEVSEITLSSEADAKAGVFRLLDSGFAVIIDEFIAGDSDFGALVSLPVRTIKIDPSVSYELTRFETARRFMRALSMLAQSMGKQLVADGVDNYQQFMFLQAIGCGYLQGRYLTAPLETHKVADFARRFMLSNASDRFAENRTGVRGLNAGDDRREK
ncbi:MAG: EAL domain-containing protein [Oleiphilaceae bacterium]|nr:EAL domain-containing protein [Oleiphilaceae bacterium]